jgi:hypothetical protein
LWACSTAIFSAPSPPLRWIRVQLIPRPAAARPPNRVQVNEMIVPVTVTDMPAELKSLGDHLLRRRLTLKSSKCSSGMWRSSYLGTKQDLAHAPNDAYPMH